MYPFEVWQSSSIWEQA